jgi:membrane associated rhomboid family serine protease
MTATGADPSQPGPLDRATAEALLTRADELLATSQYQAALALYGRVVGFPEARVTAAALYGSGECLYRLDQDGQALAQWQAVTRLPETPSTYPAWRQIAAALVRAGELRRALDAYREADKRAPAQDKAEIAARLGWLSKELGDQRAAGRYFARSRGADAVPLVTYAIIGVTAVVSLVALQAEQSGLFELLWLDKPALAEGEWWRLVSPVLVHASVLHLLFNMYALWIFGPVVEQMYGPWRYLLIYALTAAAGSLASYLFTGPTPSVGASGAIFGLMGVLLAANRAHRPVMDRRARFVMGQVGVIIVVNLLLGFGLMGGLAIDNAAHVGGLVAGLWLGFVMRPGRVATLASYWQMPRTPGQPAEPLAQGGGRGVSFARAAAVLLVPVVIVAGVVLGASAYV